MVKVPVTRSPSRKAYIEMSQYQNDPSVSAHSKRVSCIAMGCLILLSPIIVVCLWHTIVKLDGSALNMWKYWKAYNFEGVRKIWPMPSFYACKIIFTFAVFEALLQVYVPGDRHIGVTSPTGNRPVYKKNGFTCCVITLFVFYFAHKEKHFNPAAVYDHLGEIYSALIIISFIVCCLVFLKGNTYTSSTDWGFTGNPLIDFYSGLELYPRLGRDFDLKLYFISRFGMMSWACLILCFAVKQYEQKGKLADSMFVTSALQLTYIFKFFWWEGGFLNTLSMMHDRESSLKRDIKGGICYLCRLITLVAAGFYTIWGSMVWLPAVYPSPALYLVSHPVHLGNHVAICILFAGFLCIYTQYSVDYQRQEFRETHARAKLWGIMPVKIQAHYVTEKGEQKETILLASGWWGLARHIHYAFEIGGCFCWSVPALFTHASPYFSLCFLMLLLLDRVERDDKRCKAKYMKFWDQYRKKVPNKIIPLIY